jgi:hypothetical protein
MKLKDMTPEQRRDYNRIQKQQQRDREREEAAAKRIPNANDFKMPEVKQNQLDQHSSEIVKIVQAELPDHKFATQDEYVIEATAHVQFGLENNIVQKVVNPHGMLVGGHYPDAVASTTIEHVHRFPGLLGSATFKALYDKLVRAVKTWDGKFNHQCSSLELMADVRAELDGNYILKPKYAPAVPAQDVPEVPADAGSAKPTTETYEQYRQRTRVQPQHPQYLTLEARNFLDGN